jgi:hypothetical protein
MACVPDSLADVASNYVPSAKMGVFFTLIVTAIDPVQGAAWGAYYVTSIPVKIAADMCGADPNNVAHRITKSALAAIVGLAAYAAVLSPIGVSILSAWTVVFYGLTVFIESLPPGYVENVQRAFLQRLNECLGEGFKRGLRYGSLGTISL